MKQLLEMNMYKVYAIIVLVIMLCGWCINTYLDSLLYSNNEIIISDKIENGSYKVIDYSMNDNVNDYNIVYEIASNGKTYYVNDNNLSCGNEIDSDKMMIVYESNDSNMISCDMK